MKQVTAMFVTVLVLLISLPAYAQSQPDLQKSSLRYTGVVREQKSAGWSESAKPSKEGWGVKLFSAAERIQDFLTKRKLILNAYLDTTQLLIKIK